MKATVVLLISIALNVILFVLLFFKSALNDILKEWWIDKRRKRKEFQSRLIKLRKNLLNLSRLSSVVLMYHAIIQNKKDPEAIAQLQKRLKEYVDEWGKANIAIQEDEIYYPENIRSSIKKFRDTIGQATTDIFAKKVYREKLLEMMNEVTSIITSVLDKVNSLLLK